MDGVVISFAIVSGIIGANFSINIILILGAADIVADVFFNRCWQLHWHKSGKCVIWKCLALPRKTAKEDP